MHGYRRGRRRCLRCLRCRRRRVGKFSGLGMPRGSGRRRFGYFLCASVFNKEYIMVIRVVRSNLFIPLADGFSMAGWVLIGAVNGLVYTRV